MKRQAGRRCVGWDLDWPERLFITAVRVWLAGASARADFRQTLRYNLVLGDAAARSLDGFLDVLVRGARRVLWFRQCDTRRVTADERTLVALVAAAQNRDADRVQAHICWLLPKSVQAEALSHLEEFVAALEKSGLRLSLVPAPRVPVARVVAPSGAVRRSRRAPPSRA